MKMTMGTEKIQDYFHEEVLCRLKWNQDGLLEVSPGFSKEDRDYFDGDSEIFVSPENMDAKRRNDYRITTFSFTSPKGALYKYTVELLNRKDKWDELERLDLCRVDDEYKLIADRREVVFSKAKDHYAQIDTLPRGEHLLQAEIVSATNFNPKFANLRSCHDIPIFITYQIVSLNATWTSDPDSIGIPNDRIANKCYRGDEIDDTDDIVQGQTRAARPMEYSSGRSSSDIFSLYLTIILFMVSDFQKAYC